MRKIVLVVVMLAFAITSCGNNKVVDKEPDAVLKKIVDVFFDKYKKSPSDAIEYIFSTNKSFTQLQVSGLKEKLVSTINGIGGFNGVEQITVKESSSSFVLFSYMVKYDSQPVRFTFIFYKPKDHWVLYKFKFDVDLDAELEEAGRIYFLK